MRSFWSGSISFGLVNIPVKLYRAVSEHTINFDLLHEEDFSPIRYAKICKYEGREIPNQEIVKGYEYTKGQYVVVTEEDFKKTDPKKTNTIDIKSFVKEEEIDSIYYERPYYMEPDKGADKPYSLLREALAKSGKVGIASYVFHNKEHFGVLKPEKNVILLDQIYFSEDIRDASDLKLPNQSEAPEKELTLALSLIDQLTSNFKPEEYHDTYRDELMQMIKQKAEGMVPAAKGVAPQPTEVTDIMEVLRRSLEEEKSKKKAATK